MKTTFGFHDTATRMTKRNKTQLVTNGVEDLGKRNIYFLLLRRQHNAAIMGTSTVVPQQTRNRYDKYHVTQPFHP